MGRVDSLKQRIKTDIEAEFKRLIKADTTFSPDYEVGLKDMKKAALYAVFDEFEKEKKYHD